MPGKTEANAIDAFMEPVRASAALLFAQHHRYIWSPANDGEEDLVVGTRFKAYFAGGGSTDDDGHTTRDHDPRAAGVPFRHLPDLFLHSVITLEVVENETPKNAAEAYRVTTKNYAHRLEHGETRIGWHWHPDDGHEGKKDFPPAALRPHLHAYNCDIHKMHLVTGRISIEDVLIFAVEEFSIDPRPISERDDLGRGRAIADLVSRIEANRGPHLRNRSWPTPEHPLAPNLS